MDGLFEWGWQRARENQLREFPDSRPARIITISGSRFLAMSATGPLSGPLRFADGPASTWLAVGDWVALSPENRIDAILPRTSLLSRKVAGLLLQEQLLAANVDYGFVLQGLDGDFNPRRLERTVAMIYAGRVTPIVILTKEDRATHLEESLALVRAALPSVMVFSICAPEGRGIDRVRALLSQGMTGVFLGSSGSGKSTLINALLGTQQQRTGEVREDDSRGRHTTTARRLFTLPGSGMVIDTPGMRELQLWDAQEGVAATFPEIEELGKECHFRDCRHENEPLCAVTRAVEEGRLARDSWLSFQKLRREAESVAERQRLHGKDSARMRRLGKEMKSISRRKRPDW